MREKERSVAVPFEGENELANRVVVNAKKSIVITLINPLILTFC
jgi:hypothetical protein